MVFPLPFSAFEYYYLCDDRAEYPTAFPVDLRFTGQLDRACLDAALSDVLARHPLLRAVVDTSNPRPAWIAAPEEPRFDWADESNPVRHPRGAYVDLRSEPGLRAWVRTGANRARIHLQIHHACCDGLASIDFAEDLLVHYARRIGALDKEPRALDLSQLGTRDVFREESDASPGRLAWLRDAAITGREFGKLVLRTPAVLAGSGSTNGVAAPLSSTADDLDYLTCVLNAEDTRALRDAARRQSASLNDLLLRDMFVVAARWNEARNAQGGQRLRFLVPVDLRTRRDRTMPAANRMSFAFVSRRSAECHPTEQLLTTIHDDVQRLREQNLGLYFLGGLGFVASTRPAMIPWALNRQQPFATLCHSNLGRLFGGTLLERREGKVVCGPAVLESLTGVPPIRPGTRASLAILHYAHELYLCLRCDPLVFGADDRAQLMSAYIDQLGRSAGATLAPR